MYNVHFHMLKMLKIHLQIHCVKTTFHESLSCPCFHTSREFHCALRHLLSIHVLCYIKVILLDLLSCSMPKSPIELQIKSSKRVLLWTCISRTTGQTLPKFYIQGTVSSRILGWYEASMKNVTYTVQRTLPKIGAKLMLISIRTYVFMSGWA